MNGYMRDYNNLQNAFYNMDDRQRAVIGTNFKQGAPVEQEFLVYKGLVDPKQKKGREAGNG